MTMLLADSTFLIDSLRKNSNIREFLRNNPSEIFFTTEINIFELYLGLHSSKILENDLSLFKKRVEGLEELILKFQVLPLGRGEAIKAAEILGRLNKSGKPIEFRDGLVAGIALFNGINRILTRNYDHFNRIRGVEVINY